MLHLTTQTFENCLNSNWQLPFVRSDTTDAAGQQSAIFAVVMFYAVWCGKCAMMRPVIEHLEKKYLEKYPGQIHFFEVETSESALLAAQYQTDLLPTFLIFKGQEVVAVMRGIIPESTFDNRLQKIFRNS